jgi:hypothetical protein
VYNHPGKLKDYTVSYTAVDENISDYSLEFLCGKQHMPRLKGGPMLLWNITPYKSRMMQQANQPTNQPTNLQINHLKNCIKQSP